MGNKQLKPRMAILDADSILYQASLRGQVDVDGDVMQLLDISEIIRDCDDRLEEAVRAARAEKAFVCLSDRKNFRHAILPSYKGNRKPSARPIMLDDLRAHYAEGEGIYPAMLIKGLEADDVCGILAGTFQAQGYETVIVSGDKDLLQIPGLVLSRKGTSWVYSEVTEESGTRHHYFQTLRGDPVDGYTGLPGWGAVKANRLLDYYLEGDYVGDRYVDLWKAIVEAYESKGLTEEDALVQARVSRMTRLSDWDVVNKEVILWQPPR